MSGKELIARGFEVAAADRAANRLRNGWWQNVRRCRAELFHRYCLPVWQTTLPLPLTAAFFFAWVLAGNGQLLEIYRINAAQADHWPFIRGVFVLMLLSWAIFVHYLINSSDRLAVVHGILPRYHVSRAWRRLRMLVAGFSALLPLLALIIVLISLGSSASLGYFVAYAMLAVFVLATCFWLGHRTPWLASLSRWLFWVASVGLVLIPPLTPALFSIDDLVGFSHRVGPLAMVGLQFLAAFTTISLLASLVRSAWGIVKPIGAAWTLAMVVSLLSNFVTHISDPVAATVTPAGSVAPPEATELKLNLEAWVRERLARRGEPRPKDGRYLVYIVASEGGGIYAASAVASFLADMRDRCPAFTDHLFAVTGVSGGAVGAALYTSLPKADYRQRCDGVAEGTTLAQVEKLVRVDHLSPVLGVMVADLLITLGMDLWNILTYPFTAFLRPVPESLEDVANAYRNYALRRACLLEASLSRAIGMSTDTCMERKAAVPNSLVTSWESGRREHALVLTTTQAGSGESVSFAPFSLGTTLRTFHEEVRERKPDQISLITAAVASARFPLVLPPYVARKRDGSIAAFVDGGYSDNSGAGIAGQIYRLLQNHEIGDVTADVRLILLTSDDGRRQGKDALGSTSFMDFLVPIEALLKVRSRNGPRTVASILDDVAATEKVVKIDFGTDFFLGWTISHGTNGVIENSVTGKRGDQGANHAGLCQIYTAVRSWLPGPPAGKTCPR